MTDIADETAAQREWQSVRKLVCTVCSNNQMFVLCSDAHAQSEKPARNRYKVPDNASIRQSTFYSVPFSSIQLHIVKIKYLSRNTEWSKDDSNTKSWTCVWGTASASPVRRATVSIRRAISPIRRATSSITPTGGLVWFLCTWWWRISVGIFIGRIAMPVIESFQLC